MPNAEQAAPVCLDDFGDVLTDADLCRLMGRPRSWIYRERYDGNRLGIAPNLPAVAPGSGKRTARYRKVDVAEWMATGRSSARRRIA